MPTDSLLATKAVDPLWSLPDGLPIVSRKSLAEMALAVSEQQGHPQYSAFVVCVNSSVAYFLLEYTAACKTTTGLEGKMQDEVTAYFATARTAPSRIGPSCAPSLAALQALVYGVSLEFPACACRLVKSAAKVFSPSTPKSSVTSSNHGSIQLPRAVCVSRLAYIVTMIRDCRYRAVD
jgi:hypothetical protein